MKKISLLIVLIFMVIMCSYIKTNAAIIELSAQYVEINVGNDEMLELDGYEKISGIVDWSRSGEYVVTYKSDDETHYKKRFVILNEGDNSIITANEITKFHVNINNNIAEIVHINDNCYYIISNYVEELLYHDQEKVSIMYYENNNFLWEYRYSEYSRFVNYVLNGDNLIVVSEIYNEKTDYKKTILIFEISPQRNIIQKRIIDSGSGCYAKGIYLYNDYLYLITNTSGNKKDYENLNPKQENKVVIFMFSVEDFDLIDKKIIDNLNLFSIVSCSFYQTRIAINVNLKEKYISKNFEYDSCIIEIDNELTEVNRYYYDTSDKEFKSFAITSNDICIFYIDNNSYPKKIVAQYLNDEVIYKKIPFELETNYIINDVKNVSIDGNDIYLSINYIGYVDSTYLGFLKVNSFEGVDYYYNEEKKVNYLTTNLCGKSIFNWYYTNKSNNEISLKSYNILSYKTKKLETYHKNTTYKDVYFNFKKLSKNETEDTEQFKIFGNYESIDVFKLDNVSLFFKRKDEVRLQVNVLENDIYEPGYKVEFNGTGFLNGEEINNGFIVNDIGKYLLAIYGINNEKEVINFEIEVLTINPISNNYNFKIKDIEIIKTVKANDLVKTMNINIENQSNASALPVFLSILILGVLSLFFMRKKI